MRRWTVRTVATAAFVGTEMSNGVSSPAPMEITDAVRSGRRCARALAKCPPRECPSSVTGRPVSAWMAPSRSSSRASARSEQSTLNVMPEP